MTLAEQAIASFWESNTIPNLGQRIIGGFGPGEVHVFPDGSIACHWEDGDFSVAEVEQNKE